MAEDPFIKINYKKKNYNNFKTIGIIRYLDTKCLERSFGIKMIISDPLLYNGSVPLSALGYNSSVCSFMQISQ